MIFAWRTRRSVRLGAVATALLLFAPPAHAQQPQEAIPQNLTQATAPAAGVSSVESLTSGKRFKIALGNSVLSPTAYLLAAGGAGYSMAIDEEGDRGFGMGGMGFARRFGDRFGSTVVSELAGSWIAASALHQDPRYHPSQKPAFGGRVVYAVSRVFVTRNEAGNSEFNASNLIGNAAGAGASIAWHRSRDRTASNYFTTFGAYLGFNAVSNLARELLSKRKP
ncbi:MAG TPA: hypothetical protein VGL91_04440 [Acidobacteriota bacterium]|jgi:hypothetical protein